MPHITTAAYAAHIIDQLQESITEAANSVYYVYTSEHVSRSAGVIPTPIDKARTTLHDAYRHMLMGKRIGNNDLKPMVANNTWLSGTIYDMFDDNDDNLRIDNNYFVMVDEGAFLHIYKCLDNNMNVVSTAQPTFSHITGSNSILYQTSDGYRWKYMYTITDAEDDQFSTQQYIPVVPNTTVTTSAVQGALDIIKIDDGGKNYGNYTSGTFTGSEVRVGGNTLTYELGNSSVSTVNGYYTGCVLYISAGTGIGGFQTISDYFANSTGNYAIVAFDFATAPTNGSSYEINPGITINGGGEETVLAVARCLVNATSTNSIYRAEMLTRGAGYTHHTTTAIANSVVGVTSNADLRAIYSPRLGHGFEPVVELNSNKLCIGISMANTEANTIPALNDFQKLGILKNPSFANVNIVYGAANGIFINGESIYKTAPIKVDANASINTTSNLVQSNTGDFVNQFSLNDWVYLKASTGLLHMITTVNSITNSSQMTMASNCKFACTDTLIYRANVTANAVMIETTDSTNMLVDTVQGIFETDDMYVGFDSGAKANVTTMERNGVAKDFNTFVQMYKYDATMSSGTFTLDEAVFQGATLATSTANAFLHSANISGGVTTIYVTDQKGTFATANTMEGADSGALATLDTKYSPELKYGTGEILSIENTPSITRSVSTTESFKIIFQFDPST